MIKRRLLVYSIFLFLFLINIFSWTTIYNLNQSQNFEVVFFDVGQGDAALIKTHLGHYILIDGGEDSLILDKLSEEIPFFRRDIDLIILTHAHADHLGGLIEVLENYDVYNILWNGVRTESAMFSKWERMLKEGNYNIKISQLGQKIKSDNFSIDILYPLESIESQQFNDLNLSSIILRASYNNYFFLFTGDAYHENEKELIEMKEYCKESKEENKCQNLTIDSDVLKVGHHGSRTSTSEEFLKKVDPLVAVISSGKDNSYGHPHLEILELLKNYDIQIARTDQDGDIKITIDY